MKLFRYQPNPKRNKVLVPPHNNTTSIYHANETKIELNCTSTASLGEETLDLEGTIYF